jgi:hypothetical protein
VLAPRCTSSGYADAAEALRVHCEIHGKGDPIMLMPGGFADSSSMKPQFSRARLAIVPGYTHQNFSQGPDMARVIEAYLDQPTSHATRFTP